MTAARPWYKRYAQDFIMGTIGMDLESRGAYSILLDFTLDLMGPMALVSIIERAMMPA